jgi:hypothetical protein
MTHPNELPPPPNVVSIAEAREAIRLWVVGDGTQVILSPHVWPEPAYWGLALADVVRHVARAYQQSVGLDPDESANAIVDMFLAEFNNPTDEPTGEMQL